MSIARTVLCLLAVLGLIGCNRKATPEKIYVGQFAPLSGPNKMVGEQAKQGILLAVVEANLEDQLVAGRQVAVLHADSHAELDAIQPEVVRLITVNRVVALLGSTNAAPVERIEQALRPYGIALVTTGTLPAQAPNAQVYSVNVSPAYRGQVLAQFVTEELKVPRAVVLSDGRDAASTTLASAFVKGFPKGEGPRAEDWSYQSDKEFPDLVERLHKSPPGALLIAGSAADFLKLSAKIRSLERKLPLLFGGEEEEATALQADHEASKDVYRTTVFQADPAAQRFTQEYQKRFTDPPDVYAALAYDSARLLFDAIHRAQKTPGRKLREELADLETFESVTGPLSFAKGEHYARRPLFVVRVEDGQTKLVKRYEPKPK